MFLPYGFPLTQKIAKNTILISPEFLNSHFLLVILNCGTFLGIEHDLSLPSPQKMNTLKEIIKRKRESIQHFFFSKKQNYGSWLRSRQVWSRDILPRNTSKSWICGGLLCLLTLGSRLFIFMVNSSIQSLRTQKRDVLAGYFTTCPELWAPMPFRIWKEACDLLGLCFAKWCNSPSKISLPKS